MEQLYNKRRRATTNSPPRSKTKKGTSTSGQPDYKNLGSGDEHSVITRETADSDYDDGTSNNERDDNNGTIYTFIIHKSSIPPIPPTTKKAPTFATSEDDPLRSKHVV
jgi:hypothetical protein